MKKNDKKKEKFIKKKKITFNSCIYHINNNLFMLIAQIKQ